MNSQGQVTGLFSPFDKHYTKCVCLYKRVYSIYISFKKFNFNGLIPLLFLQSTAALWCFFKKK